MKKMILSTLISTALLMSFMPAYACGKHGNATCESKAGACQCDCKKDHCSTCNSHKANEELQNKK